MRAVSGSDNNTPWQPGDDPLENLPEPAEAAVAQWRSQGVSDTQIRSRLLTAAYWDGADGVAARLYGNPVPPPGPWQRALHELHRRDAVNRAHEAETRRLSDARDAALSEPDTSASPSPPETPPKKPETPPKKPETPSKPSRAELRQARETALAAYRKSPSIPVGADAQYRDYNKNFRDDHPDLPKIPRVPWFRPK
jgi:hypothetical protein